MSTEPVSLDTMYVFNRSYHSVQCSLAMCVEDVMGELGGSLWIRTEL